jgi:hypothetical protein
VGFRGGKPLRASKVRADGWRQVFGGGVVEVMEALEKRK